jgi:retinol dehydrogenase-13
MKENGSEKKKVIVSGATGAIGRAIASQIASEGKYEVWIVARNREKALRTVEEIGNLSGNPDINYLIADLSDKSDVQSIASGWKGPLHILVNNAAATPRQREETAAGIEMQFATNVLGYYWMITYFLPYLKLGKASRIVNVASYWAGGLDLHDPEFKHRHYHNDAAYRQSKQADRMLSGGFAERLEKYGITVNACHPGDVNSKLSNNLGFGGHESPDQGADTPVWLATSPEVEGMTGKYFEHRSESGCYFIKDKAAVGKLFEICSKY